jgi:hypothetical protein
MKLRSRGLIYVISRIFGGGTEQNKEKPQLGPRFKSKTPWILVLLFFYYLFGLWGYWHCGHSGPIVPASGDIEDDCGEADGM